MAQNRLSNSGKPRVNLIPLQIELQLHLIQVINGAKDVWVQKDSVEIEGGEKSDSTIDITLHKDT